MKAILRDAAKSWCRHVAGGLATVQIGGLLSKRDVYELGAQTLSAVIAATLLTGVRVLHRLGGEEA